MEGRGREAEDGKIAVGFIGWSRVMDCAAPETDSLAFATDLSTSCCEKR